MVALHLTLAYVIFCAVPLGLAFSLWLRRRRVQRTLTALEERAQE